MKRKTKIIAFVASAVLTVGILKATIKRPHFSKMHHKFMKEHHHKSCDKAEFKNEKPGEIKLEHIEE